MTGLDGRVKDHLGDRERRDPDRDRGDRDPHVLTARADPEHERGDGERQADPEASRRQVPRDRRAGDREQGEGEREAGPCLRGGRDRRRDG